MRGLLPDALRACAEDRPAHPAVRARDAELTYTQLWTRSVRLSHALRERGVGSGDRVALLLDNTCDCAVALHAVWLADAVTVALNVRTKSEKLGWILRDSSAVALIAERHLAGTYGPALVGSAVRSVLVVGGSGPLPLGTESLEAALGGGSETPATNRAQPEDLAAILYTSGTTGEPKGVMHTHASLGFTRRSVVEYLGLRADDRMLCALPLSFGYGLFQLLPSITVGATVVLEPSTSYPAQIFARMQSEQVTTVAGVPTFFALMLAHDAKHPLRYPSVRLVTNAAAPLPEEFVAGIGRLFPQAALVKMYGQTECIRACYLPPAMLARKAGAIGIAIPGTELLLLDDEGHEVAVGETGTLHVCGPNLMRGYWNDPRRTAVALVPGRVAGETLLRTGDSFRRDDDGVLYFVGRQDEIIKSRGEKVSPIEVENVIHGLFEVAEVVVLGVPDPVLGEAVVALVVLKEGQTVEEIEVKRACSARLEHHMVPKRVFVVAEIPRTANGKVSRKAVAERFHDLLAARPR